MTQGKPLQVSWEARAHQSVESNQKMVLKRLFIGDTGEASAHSFRSVKRQSICLETRTLQVSEVVL